MKRERFGFQHELVMAESSRFYLCRSSESAYLVSRKGKHDVALVGDHYGDVQAGIIDRNERFCVTVGCGFIVYFMYAPYRSYQYETVTSRWYESGRGPKNIHWYEKVRQLNDDEIELTDEDGNTEIISISSLWDFGVQRQLTAS